MFPRLDAKLYPIADDRQFFMEVLRVTRVMLVQGSGFNYPDNQHFRMVFLPHEDDLREAIHRLAKFLEQYRARYARVAAAPTPVVDFVSKKEAAARVKNG
jgi:alanine-synthesizing transaminase